MNEIPIHATGRLTGDPELVYRRDSVAVARVAVDVLERRLTTEGWRIAGKVTLDCRAWGPLAKHIHTSLRDGDYVLLHGRLRQRPVSPGVTVFEVVLTDLGPNLAYGQVRHDADDDPHSACVDPSSAVPVGCLEASVRS